MTYVPASATVIPACPITDAQLQGLLFIAHFLLSISGLKGSGFWCGALSLASSLLPNGRGETGVTQIIWHL